jgi:hypothetical protein
VAGLLDGTDAAVVIPWMTGIAPIRIFQFIASGVLGVRAFRGGFGAAILGLALHLLIAIGAASVYYALTARLTLSLRQRVLVGPVFGLGVFAVMNYVVVPLSAAPRQPAMKPDALLNQLFSHLFFVGLPIAVITGRRAMAWSSRANQQERLSNSTFKY